MKNYTLNFYQIAKNLLPHFLQKKALLGWVTSGGFFWVTATGESWGTGEATRHLAWLQSLMAPLQSLNATFVAFVADVRYRLNLTGQVIYLEHYLNDLYDPIQRRIYISDGDPSSPIFVYNKADGVQDVVIYNKADAQPATYLNTKADFDGQVDFIINIPFDLDLTPILEDKIKASTNIYKPAGRRYRIDDTDGGDQWSEG